MALAQAEGEAVAVDWRVGVAKAIAAGAAMSVSAMSAGYAQARIGAAGAGTLAERPEAGTNIIVLQALPEVIVLLGFVIAFMIGTA
jgi:V/A-type H+-transporting ATPase subunit K